MRLAAALFAIAAAMVVSTTAAAQALAPIDALQLLLDGLTQSEGTTYRANEVAPGESAWRDEGLDLEHPSGDSPGFNAQFIDITGASISIVDAGPASPHLFGPTADNPVWPETEARLVERGTEQVVTITGPAARDGLSGGDVVMFGIDLGATPPIPVDGTCEYTVWLNDSSNPARFANLPDFPNDPAIGANKAFGVRLNPEGEALTNTFSLALTDFNVFVETEVDVRAFIAPEFVGLFAPAEEAAALSEINFYSACASEGVEFDSAVAASDQTGLLATTPQTFGRIEATTAPTLPAGAASEALADTSPSPSATSDVSGTVDDRRGETGLVWVVFLLLLTGGAGFWFLRERRQPCAEVIREARAAARACRRARSKSARALKKADRAGRILAELNQTRSELIASWPPLTWDTPEGPAMEDGRGIRVTGRGLHMRRVALGSAWEDYRAGRLTITEVETLWEERGGEEFVFRFDAMDAERRSELAGIDARLDEVTAEAERADGFARAAESAAETACAESGRLQGVADDCRAVR